jgi:hypothetical protein
VLNSETLARCTLEVTAAANKAIGDAANAKLGSECVAFGRLSDQEQRVWCGEAEPRALSAAGTAKPLPLLLALLLYAAIALWALV